MSARSSRLIAFGGIALLLVGAFIVETSIATAQQPTPSDDGGTSSESSANNNTSDGGAASTWGGGGEPSEAGVPDEEAGVADAGAPTPTTIVDAGAADAAPADAGVTQIVPEAQIYRRANTWDLNIEGGGGYVFGDVEKWTGFVRARPGVLIVRNDDFYQFGLTAEYLGMLKRPAFGAQVEYLHLQMGTWIQAGGSFDTKGRPGVNASLGISLFGIEAQVREFDASHDPAFVFLAKVRLPIGILIYGLRTRK